ncbi:hypothetical protein ACWGE0_09720 [Lentzea sp. NPDC054927]
MAPCFDIYVRLPDLNRRVVEDFLERHVLAWRESATWFTEDAAAILERGLGGSRSGEALYAGRSKGLRPADLEFVMLAFPRDGGFVLGVSIDAGMDEEAAAGSARRWLAALLEETGAQQGFAQVEEPPPVTDAEWQEAIGRASATCRRCA